MASNKDFLDLLVQRQAEPMNTLEDKPQWLKNGEECGQQHIFSSAVMESTVAADALPSLSNTASPAISAKAVASGDFNTADWNWRENPRGDEGRKARDAAQVAQGKVIALAEADTLLLVNTFIESQAARVQAYVDYNATFESLLKNARLADYPQLVAEITSRFATISLNILAVRHELIRRAEAGDNAAKDVTRCIALVQAQEQEKLAVVAAAHLDRMKEALPAMSVQLGRAAGAQGSSMEHVSQAAYTKKRVEEIEQKISEVLEEVAEAKCELLLG